MVPLLLALAASSPAHAASFSVVGSLVREDTLEPGGSVEGWLDVRSHSDEALSLVVSSRDFLSQADGTNFYGEQGSVERSNGAWISFTPHQLTLEPGATQRVHYRVDVPDDAALAGTFWSLLMVEPAVPEPPAEADRTARVSIRTVVRYAVQIATHVGERAGGELAFEHVRLAAGVGGPSLSMDVANVGTWRLAPRVWVELYDDAGWVVGRYEAKGQPGLYPGCSARYTFDLAGVRPGTYTAFTVADAGQDAVFGSEIPLELR